MDKSKRIIAILSFVVFCTVSGFTLYRYVRFGTIDGGSIFFSFLSLSYLLNWVKWGDHEGGGEKDELDRHIQTESAKIGYFVLMVLASLILFISEGVSNLNEIENFPLLIVVCLTFITLPITEIIYSKKYK
jgi:hypothetical protein